MAAFFYFLESITVQELAPQGRLDRAVLAKHGLDDVLSDVRDVPDHAIVTPTTNGPSGQPGVLLFPVTAGSVPKIPAMHDGQQWSHSQIGNRKGPAPWIGIIRDDPPRPEELLRSPHYPGYTVSDRHGRSWSVPMIRGLDRPYGSLPCDWDWPDDGECATGSASANFEPRAVLRHRYQQLWDDSAKVWDWCYVDNSPHTVTETWIAGFVARVLSINHRVGPRELNVLRSLDLAAFDRDTLAQFASAAVDVQAVIEFTTAQKKTPPLPTPDGATSSPGTPAVTSTGDQPEAN